MASIGVSNYNKPTPRFWKIAGDLGLLLIPTIQLGVQGAPPNTFTDYQLWLISLTSSIGLVAFKFVTKMFGEDVNQQEQTG